MKSFFEKIYLFNSSEYQKGNLLLTSGLVNSLCCSVPGNTAGDCRQHIDAWTEDPAISWIQEKHAISFWFEKHATSDCLF